MPWLTEEHVKEQADVMASKLESHGYEYVNIDAGWATSFDEYGRPVPNSETFPSGMKSLGDYLHAKDLKFGLYLAVGLDPAAYNDGKNPIYNAPGCTTADIVYPDLRKTNGWDYAYKMDFDDPCSQKYIDSLADQLAGWGVGLPEGRRCGPGLVAGRREPRQHLRREGVAHGAATDGPPDPVHLVVVAEPHPGRRVEGQLQRMRGSTRTSSATATRW